MQVSAELGMYLVGAVVLIGYFTLFIKAVNSLPDDERKRLATAKSSKLPWLSALPVVAVFFVGNFYFRIFLGVLYCAWTAWASHRHYELLRQLEFDPKFVGRLRRIDVLSGIGVCLLIGGAIASA